MLIAVNVPVKVEMESERVSAGRVLEKHRHLTYRPGSPEFIAHIGRGIR